MKTIRKCLFLVILGMFSGSAVIKPADSYSQNAVYTPKVRSIHEQKQAPKILDEDLTLDRAINIALANNPDISAGTWSIQAARAQKDIAVAQRWPHLHSVGSYASLLYDQMLVPRRSPGVVGTFSDEIISGDLIINMPIFTGGRITNEIKAAELLWEAEEYSLNWTSKELIFNVSSVFYNILAQRRVIESLDFSRKAMEEHCERVTDLIAVKKAARVDLLRTDVRLADLTQKMVQEKNLLTIQLRVLANLLGIGQSQSLVSVKGELDLGNKEENVERDLAKAYAIRPDYQAALVKVKSQVKRLDAARAVHWPAVSLLGSYGRRWSAGSSISQPGRDKTANIGQVGAVINVPIFEGGRVEARVRREQANLAGAHEALRKLELKICLEVETASLNITSNRERVRATDKAIEQAKESMRIEREKYDLGKGSITDVLDAQSALLEAQMNYYRALAGYKTSVAQLRLALGEEP